jgi:hypothetical protein
MTKSSSYVPPPCASAQVWGQLDTTRRQQTIAVVAQMAFNVVKTQTASLSQEEDDAHAPLVE